MSLLSSFSVIRSSNNAGVGTIRSIEGDRVTVAPSLQIEQHLTLALETGYQASEKPVGEAIVDSVLSKQIDDLEPTLTRHGYTAKG